MALTPEMQNYIKSTYNLGTITREPSDISAVPQTPSLSNDAITREVAGLRNSTTSLPTERPGFLSSLAKSIVKPFAEVGTSAYNVAASTGKLLTGDKEGAVQAIGSKRTLPFLGETKPAFTGEETNTEAAKKIGISFPTLSRIENEKTPDIFSLAQVCVWLNRPIDTYFTIQNKSKK